MELTDWLKQIEKNSPVDVIKLGLDRVKNIASDLQLLDFSATVIMVAGTNGKGSTVATLESLLVSHHQSVGTYTSPHLINFNERIKINSTNVDAPKIIQAFEQINNHHNSYQLTYYEWVTLAALIIFQQEKLDYILLEVGLGGRLDAVNIIDADVAIITSIDFDHTDLLGNSLDEIAFEKSGVFRDNQTVFCAEPTPPTSLLTQATKNNVKFNQINKDYSYSKSQNHWQFKSHNINYNFLELTNLHLNNVATALACFSSLAIKSSTKLVNSALKQINLVGRCQYIETDFKLLLDVAHNQQSLNNLAKHLTKLSHKCNMVFSMLNNKDLESSISTLKPFVKNWYIAPLQSPRSYTQAQISETFQNHKINNSQSFITIPQAFKAAKTDLQKEQTLVVCGSFFTVSEIL